MTGLDKIQIAALRKADRISFHHTPSGGGEEAKSYIRATKDLPANERDPFAPRESSVWIDVDFSLKSYEIDGATYPLPDFKGFEMIHTPQHEDWRTIADILKPEDVIRLVWEQGALTTGDCKDAGIGVDRLRLCVYRGDKPRMAFTIGVQAVKTNYPYRMIVLR